MLFATLVILMSLYQATVVPGENREVEFDDYQDATGDVSELRNAMLATAAGGGQSGVTVRTGSQYPARALFVNPPPATGQLHTTDAANVTLWNVTAADDAGNVDAYLDSEGDRLNYSTRRLVFDPAYNEFQGAAPVVVSGGLVYRDYDEPVPVAGQTLVRGNRLTLVTLAGNLSAGGYRTPVTAEALSAHTRTVTVESRDGDPFNVTVPTTLDAATWRDSLLADQLDPPGGQEYPDRYVRDVRSAGPNAVNVTLEGDATYELRVARVGVREHGDSLDADAPDPRYLTRVGDRSVTTERDGRRALTVEVRDRYSNPVSDANVTFDQPGGKGTFETADGDPVTFPIRTDEDGRATVYYNATGHLGTIPMDAYLGSAVDGSLPAEKRVQWSVFNSILGGDGDGGSGEQAGRSLLVLDGYDQPNGDSITFHVNNTGEFDVNVTGYRLDYVTAISSNAELIDGPDAIEQITLDPGPDEQTRVGTAQEARSPQFLGSDPINVTGQDAPSNGDHDLRVTFDSNVRPNNEKGVMVSFAIYVEGGFTVTFTAHILV